MTIDEVYRYADVQLQQATVAQRIAFYQLTKAQQTNQIKATLNAEITKRQAEFNSVDARAAAEKTALTALIADLQSGVLLL